MTSKNYFYGRIVFIQWKFQMDIIDQYISIRTDNPDIEKSCVHYMMIDDAGKNWPLRFLGYCQPIEHRNGSILSPATQLPLLNLNFFNLRSHHLIYSDVNKLFFIALQCSSRCRSLVWHSNSLANSLHWPRSVHDNFNFIWIAHVPDSFVFHLLGLRPVSTLSVYYIAPRARVQSVFICWAILETRITNVSDMNPWSNLLFHSHYFQYTTEQQWTNVLPLLRLKSTANLWFREFFFARCYCLKMIMYFWYISFRQTLY